MGSSNLLRLDQTWVGLGIKVGGMIFIGAETFEGVAWRADTLPSNSAHEVNVTSIRLGIGGGGSVGLSLFFAFNAPILWSVDGLSVTDWGLNVALPAGKLGVGKFSFNVLKGLRKIDRKALKLFTPKMLQDLRTMASAIYSGLIDVGGGIFLDDASVVVIDVPEAGWGAELSAFATGGEVSVGGKLG